MRVAVVRDEFEIGPSAVRLVRRKPSADEIESAVLLYQNTRAEYPELFSAEKHLIDHSLPQLPPHKAEEILQKLRDLIQDAMESKTTGPGSVPMALTVLLYPLPRPARAPKEHNVSGESGEGEK